MPFSPELPQLSQQLEGIALEVQRRNPHGWADSAASLGDAAPGKKRWEAKRGGGEFESGEMVPAKKGFPKKDGRHSNWM